MTHPAPKRRLEFFYFDAGGGHRSAALALQSVLAQQYPEWDVELVNLQDTLDAIDPFFKLTNVQSQDIYNKYIKSGKTYGSRVFLRTIQTSIKFMAPQIEARLREHWYQSNPDLVISLIPNFNRPLFRSLKKVWPNTPYITIMTDMADCPKHFWIEQQDQFFICATDLAVRQALKLKRPRKKILKTSGMIIRPQFYEPQTEDRSLGRQRLNLDPHKLTALIMFGGYGSQEAAHIVDRLNKSGLPVQSIVICGHNENLRREIAGKPNCHAVGFTKDVPAYMHLADFFIGKPGPGSISEALHMGLPVILERNMRTLYQERYNTRWVKDRGLGIIINDFDDIPDAVHELLQNNKLAEFQANARKINNRAVFEIPAMLDKIMSQNAMATRGSSQYFSPLPVKRKPGKFLIKSLRQ